MTIQQAETAARRPPAEQAPTRGAGSSRPRRLDRSAPRPTSRTHRILFVGTGLDHGWGVRSARPAPTLEVARAVRAITGTACQVDAVADSATAAAIAAHAERAEQPYDAAVVAVGALDAMRLTPVAEWGARLLAITDALHAALPADAPVLLVGTPTVHVPKRIRPLNPIALRHARRLDRVAHRLAEMRHAVHFLPAPCMSRLVGQRAGGDLSSAFTLPIATALSSVLRERVQATSEPTRVDRLDVHAIVDAQRSDPGAALASIVRRAAEEFAVDQAAVALFDGERLWRVSSSATTPMQSQEPLTGCETVICTGHAVIRSADGTDAPLGSAPGMPSVAFYAGVPVHALDGTTVGAMCLLHGSARTDRQPVDLDRLRDFAHEVQRAMRSAVEDAGWLDPEPVG